MAECPGHRSRWQLESQRRTETALCHCSYRHHPGTKTQEPQTTGFYLKLLIVSYFNKSVKKFVKTSWSFFTWVKNTYKMCFLLIKPPVWTTNNCFWELRSNRSRRGVSITPVPLRWQWQSEFLSSHSPTFLQIWYGGLHCAGQWRTKRTAASGAKKRPKNHRSFKL